MEKPEVSPNFSRKTVTWVGGVHLLILLGLALIPFLSRHKPPEKMLEMVELGSANPGKGSAAGSTQATSADGGSPSVSKNSQDAPPPPAPPPPHKSESKPAKETKPPEPVKEEAKVEPVPVKVEPKPEKVEKTEPKPIKPVEVKKVEIKKPAEVKPTEVKTPKPKAETDKPKEEVKKPAKTPVKIDLGSLKKITATAPSSVKPSPKASDDGQEGGVEGGVKEGKKNGVVGSNGTNPEAKGPSASDLKQALTKGLQSVGVVNGSGSGAAGSPDGSAYNALIKKTLTGNWVKPTSAGGSLTTLVKIRIKPDGSVEVIGISDPSGNKAMDQSVLDAVKSTGTLSKPLPEGLGSPDYVVVVNFQLD